MTEQERDSVDKNEPGKLARAVVAELDPAQREVLADYMASLILLRQRELPAQTKVLDSIDLTADRQVLGVLTKGSGRLLAKHAWKDRSWAARIGLSAAALASILTAGQGAGIALLGTAVGVPLWIVFGAGGTFAGALIDEVARSRTGVERPADTAPSTDSDPATGSDPDSLDVDQIVDELEAEFSGEAAAKRIDEELGIEPDPVDVVRERLEQLKEEVRSGGNPSQLLQKWLLRRKQ
jgi:hypothetical protein